MTFKKYSSLENHTNSKFIEKCFNRLMSESTGLRTEFVAREKIHGTNFSIIITKDEIIPAKRSGPILPTEKFFGYEDLMKDLNPLLLDIQKLMNKNLSEGWNSIHIFGEYAGGSIQKEVDYGDKSFYVFDIYLDAPDAGISHGWWTDEDVQTFCDHHGFKIAPLVGRGTLEEMLKLPVEFDSIVPSLTWNNMYDIHIQPAPKDNVAEGLVIKPNRPLFIGETRLAIKYKTDAFKEKGKGKAPKIPVPLSDNDKNLLFELSKFATPQRISNVASHIGEITQKDFGKILGLTMHDLLKEAEREGVSINLADAPSKLKGEVQKIVQDEVRAYWLTLDFS